MPDILARLRHILCAYVCKKTASASLSVLPQIVLPENCKHPDWTEETQESGFRSHCKQCGVRSEGSCQ